MELAFISNVNITRPSGGWDGLGAKVFEVLTTPGLEMVLIDRINPPYNTMERYTSKALRTVGMKGNYPAFSHSRLLKIKREFLDRVPPVTDYLFFHGATPWISIRPRVKYSVLLDCNFSVYMKVYHPGHHFSKTQLQRIEREETLFLAKAHKVFFTSGWAAEETRKDYSLDGTNFVVMGQGPSVEIDPAIADTSLPLKQFLFIATDFFGKGGSEICSAFKTFLFKYPDYKLIIVGQQPPAEVLTIKNVQYLGYIDKNTEAGLAVLLDLYRSSSALLLYTIKDIAPLVIIEAGLMGCPAVANNISAMPEMIRDKETGFLVSNATGLLDAMLEIARMEVNQAIKIRKAVKAYMDQSYSWNTVRNVLRKELLF